MPLCVYFLCFSFISYSGLLFCVFVLLACLLKRERKAYNWVGQEVRRVWEALEIFHFDKTVWSVISEDLSDSAPFCCSHRHLTVILPFYVSTRDSNSGSSCFTSLKHISLLIFILHIELKTILTQFMSTGSSSYSLKLPNKVACCWYLSCPY